VILSLFNILKLIIIFSIAYILLESKKPKNNNIPANKNIDLTEKKINNKPPDNLQNKLNKESDVLYIP